MKKITDAKLAEIIKTELDTITEIVGEYGDEAWMDEDIMMLMDKHGISAKEAVQVLENVSFALTHINAAAVFGADKAAKTALTYFDLDDAGMASNLWAYTRDGASRGMRENMLKLLRYNPVAFIAAIKDL